MVGHIDGDGVGAVAGDVVQHDIAATQRNGFAEGQHDMAAHRHAGAVIQRAGRHQRRQRVCHRDAEGLLVAQTAAIAHPQAHTVAACCQGTTTGHLQ